MAFVHLHNHSDFSILDAATRVPAMVRRAVDLKMPALALTDHGYMFGVPEFDLECRKYNDAQQDMHQWKHDVECFEKGWELEEPPADAAEAAGHDCAHAQWASDVRVWGQAHDLAAVQANRPSLTIKPVFGCEAYFITDDCIEKGTKQHRYHLILLAKNERGYVNLMKMMSEAASGDMFYYYPRTTLEMLRRYHEGIICSSACVSGIIPQMYFAGRADEARLWALTYREIFGDDFYLEVQDHGLSDPSWGGFSDRTLSEQIVRLGHELGIKVIATNDNHYLTRDDAPTQDVLSCIGTASKLDDANRKRMTGSEFYLKSEDEMRELFSWAPEVIENTLEVADKCSYELDWTHMYLPKFPDLAPGETSEERFRKECEEGLARRYGPDWKNTVVAGTNVSERFEYEYKIICDKGFADYFLIVQEYVRWAKQNGIGVGPGRGSAAGAIVAYAMDITTFDPLENGLMFERFLSPQRSEMPDIDMDFDDERRLEVVEHVRQLYGPERVCHVITYSTIKAKQAINDAARVLSFPVWAGQKLSKMISNDPRLTLDHALHKSDDAPDQYSPDFEEAYRTDPDATRIIDAALSIEGLHRGEGVHACAVLIAPTPVNDHVPTKMDTKGGVEITQYEGHSVADMGLLKMDFLGLRTLTVISRAKANIKANYGIDIDVDKIPFDDPEIYRLMREGRTAGVFQIESAGMTSTIKGMKPTEYKQVVALIALYRPGPLGAGMVTDYIDRMNGKKEVVYYDDRLADILEETYGTIVYQEQVMQISMKMSGFSAGESDKVRKAVAKKKIKLMEETVQHWDDGTDETMHAHWTNGAERNGYRRELAERIWADVLKFASYAFNKSHSAGYAILVMQTAWLKAHYPREYMASVLTSYMGKTDKIVHYVTAYRHEGVDILPPDINESGRDFTATSEGVRFGFAGIRGVGEGVGEAIMAEREKAGPFKNLHDFVDRMDSGQANRRVVEALICSGAFDSTGYTRMQLMRFVDKTNPENVVDAATRRQKQRAVGQFSMFDLFGDVEGSGFESSIPEPDNVEWDRSIKLSREHEVLGLYVSDHPLRPYEYALAKNRDYTIADIEVSEEVADPSGGVRERFKVAEGKPLRLAGMVTAVQKKTTKNGDSMAIVTLEDMEGEVTLVVFPKLYKKCAATLAGEVDEETGDSASDVFVKVEGKLERSDRGNQIICLSVEPLVLDEKSNRPKVLEVNMPSSLLTRSYMDSLGRILARYPGLDHVELRVESTCGDVMCMELPCRVDAHNMVLLAEMIDLVGSGGCVKVA
ncbi:DNA polymerase III subunit alpha [Thermophilibacter immobilis]|uniref:DNA polymerase III subunit alpha n=1 Tax=Thermophilibacter immobilis TaxID=2779519 RepID=A0A7S7RTZ9_9ACTN|nr:DNA polymerase III subunit alpha [Thermophilibacter immobilis]QOY60135.1 DNA polymerase III subunit alpha [Thermophilibacter immobilis]